jgi:hypothetical protein
MMLYKITGSIFKDGATKTIKFILAVSEKKAIEKYLTLNNVDSRYIVAEVVCRRDEIIPTIEPQIEFAKQEDE